MTTSFQYSLLIVSCIFFLQCNSAKKIPGHAGNDFERLIKKLEKNPTDEKTFESIGSVYKKEQQQHLAKIEMLEKDRSVLNTELILKEYIALQQLYSSLQSVPGLSNRIELLNYSDKIETCKKNLIKELTEEADYYLKRGDKFSCRKSYLDLLKLQTYQPVNMIDDKLRQSLDCASLNIAIAEPAIDNRFSHYNIEIGNFYQTLLSALQTNKSLPFIRIESVNPQTDESIRVRFTQFEIGVVTKDNNSRDVVNNQPYTSGGRRGTTGTAPSAATITTTRVNSLSVADLQIDIQNTKGTVITTQEFNARHEWNNEVNTYSGDRRALTANDRAQLRNPVKNPPTENEIVNDLLSQLTEKLMSYLQTRYAGL